MNTKNAAILANPASYDLQIIVEMFRSATELATALRSVMADGATVTADEARRLRAALIEARTEFAKALTALEG